MLENKIAIITGASRGIGAEIALQLGKKGAIIAGTATTTAGAEKITAALQAANVKGQGFVLNVDNNQSVELLINSVNEQFGAPTILVNNAGITRDNLFLRMKEDEWIDVINTNLNAIYRMTKACLKPMLKARWGRIITISSLSGVAGNPGQCNYAAAKAGVIGFSKSLAMEVATRGITVNVVAPGLIDTDMASKLTEEQQQYMLANTPLQRLGTVAEVASGVVFLASPEASYITGETLNINGGLYMN